MKILALFAMLFLFGLSLAADPPLDTKGLERILRNVTPVELPAAAAQLVSQAHPEDREATATNIVKLALRINPAATVAVVDTVSRVDSNLAAVVSEVAVEAQPALDIDIARCASAAAPNRAADIVTRTSRIVPEDLSDLAIAAAVGAPAATLDILRAVGAARPELGPYIEDEILRCGTSRPSVPGCLARAKQHAGSNWKDDRDLSHPGHPGPPDSKPPHEGGDPPGGRNYARP